MSGPLTERADLEAAVAEHAAWIGQCAAHVARRHGLRPDDAEEFGSWVRARIVARDYEVLRKFRGDSSLRTYLAVVVSTFFRDFRAERWGRWRPSAAAQRIGPPAPSLESLVCRYGYSLSAAGELLRTRGETAMSDAELARLLARLPNRPPLRPVQVGSAVLETTSASHQADAEVKAAESERERGRVYALLARSLEGLSAEDRAMVRMYFWEGMTIAAIAVSMGCDAKPLYRRMDRVKARLRGELETAGLRGAEVRGMLEEGAE
jgi:RNA polymerase sigma factor for flagellar operon FliA